MSGTDESTRPSRSASITGVKVTLNVTSSNPARQCDAVRKTVGRMSVPVHHCVDAPSTVPTRDRTFGYRLPAGWPNVMAWAGAADASSPAVASAIAAMAVRILTCCSSRVGSNAGPFGSLAPHPRRAVDHSANSPRCAHRSACDARGMPVSLAPARPVTAFVADAACLVLFSAIGRRSHGEALDLAGVLTTLWPFLAGLVVAWLAGRLWRAPARGVPPRALARAGAPVGGVLLRAAGGPGGEPAVVGGGAGGVAVVVLGSRG